MKEIKDVILNLENLPIYISGHINPDCDSIGSSMALAIFLNKLNKETYVLLKETDLSILNFKPDYSLIRHEIKDKNYVFISLDVNEKRRISLSEDYFDNARYTINIDHHQDNKYEANYTLSNTSVSSTCEIIFNIIKEFSLDYIDNDIAEFLYAGIMSDTNCFSRRISSQTMSIAQYLINMGINYTNIIRNTNSHRTMYEMRALASLINELRYDTFHYLVIDKSLDIYRDLTYNEIMKVIAEEIRKIEDIDTFILLVKEKNKIVGKCMTNTSENANIIASLFGGGGHKKEAGFTIYDVSEKEIFDRCKEFINK